MTTLNFFKIICLILFVSLLSCSENKNDIIENAAGINSETELGNTKNEVEIKFIPSDSNINLAIDVVVPIIKDATYVWTITNSTNNNIYIDDTNEHSLHWEPKAGETNFCVTVITNNTETVICKTFNKKTT